MRCSCVGQDHLELAAVEVVEHRQEVDLAVGELCEVGHGGLEVVHETLQLSGRDQRARLADPREARVDRGRRLADAGDHLERPRARGREGRVQVVERGLGGLEHLRQLVDRRAQVRLLGRERAHGHVEVRDQVLQRALARGQRGEDLLLAADQLGEVVQLGARASRRSGPRRRAARRPSTRASRSATCRPSRPSCPDPGRRPRRAAVVRSARRRSRPGASGGPRACRS